MKKYKILLEIVLKELQPAPNQIQEIIKKYNLDEHLSVPLKFYYKKSKKIDTNA